MRRSYTPIASGERALFRIACKEFRRFTSKRLLCIELSPFIIAVLTTIEGTPTGMGSGNLAFSEECIEEKNRDHRRLRDYGNE